MLQARDDDFANEVEIQDADDKDDDPESPFKGVQIQLAPSETKPYTRCDLKHKIVIASKNSVVFSGISFESRISHWLPIKQSIV